MRLRGTHYYFKLMESHSICLYRGLKNIHGGWVDRVVGSTWWALHAKIMKASDFRCAMLSTYKVTHIGHSFENKNVSVCSLLKTATAAVPMGCYSALMTLPSSLLPFPPFFSMLLLASC